MKTLEITENGVTANLTIRHASVGDDMRRNMLAAQAYESPLADAPAQAVAALIYPRCLACASGEIDGKPVEGLSAADFSALPFEIGEAWLTAALELNPRWDFTRASSAAADAPAQKKD